MVRSYWCKADFGPQLLLSLLLLANGERKGVTGGHWQWHWEIPQNSKVEMEEPLCIPSSPVPPNLQCQGKYWPGHPASVFNAGSSLAQTYDLCGVSSFIHHPGCCSWVWGLWGGVCGIAVTPAPSLGPCFPAPGLNLRASTQEGATVAKTGLPVPTLASATILRAPHSRPPGSSRPPSLGPFA